MRSLIELVFPPRCAGCDRPGTLLCPACAAEVSWIDAAGACARCGAPDGAGCCAECAGRAFAFTRARCAALLAHPVSRAVVLYKDGGERRQVATLATLVAETAQAELAWADALVPVPATSAAIRRRGFDHVSLLAHVLSAIGGPPVAEPLRACGARDQRTLGREGRLQNAAGRFALRGSVGVPRRIVLLDDVFTTGATLDAAATALLQAGAEEVCALAVARACSPLEAS